MELKSLSLLCLALAGTGAFAQTAAPAPDYTFGFNVGANTDYRFRGISQTRFDPSIFGGIDFTHSSGLYVGTWASNIKWIKDAGGDADAEVDVYAGYKAAIGDFSYDVGVLRYLYPSANLAVSPFTTEIYGALSYGPFTAKYSHSLTNTFGFSDSEDSGYLDISASFDLGSGWSVVPHIGRQRIAGNTAGVSNSQFSYTDYALTVNKDFGNGFVASLSAIGTNAKKASYFVPLAGDGRYTGRDTVVLGVKYSF